MSEWSWSDQIQNDCLGNGGSNILAGSLRYCAVVVTGVNQHESGVWWFGVAGVLPFLIRSCVTRMVFKQRCWHKERLQCRLRTQCSVDECFGFTAMTLLRSRKAFLMICLGGKTKHFVYTKHAHCYIHSSIRATVYWTLYKWCDGGADQTKILQTFALYCTQLLSFNSSSFLFIVPNVYTFLTLNQLVLHSDSTLGTFGRKSIVPSARVPRA